MTLTRLRLLNFRNYESLDLSFDEGVNAVLGRNGSGKTNLAEAVHYLSLARSFRSSDDEPLIRHGCETAVLEAEISEGELRRTLEIEIGKGAKRVKLNGKPLRRLSELSRLVNVLLFCPSDVALFTGSPSERRNFLDVSLSKQSSDYFRLISRYGATLKERNALLKQARPDLALLDVLTDQLIDLEEPLVSYRSLFLSNLESTLPGVLSRLRGEATGAELIYRPFVKPGDGFKERAKKAYEASKESDLLHRSTSVGVHREDFSFRFNGKDVATYGSQGENRMAALALKLSPYYLIEKEERKPICVLDDVTSELDAKKIENLLALLKDFHQTFLTTTDITIENATYIDVASNKATRRNEHGR